VKLQFVNKSFVLAIYPTRILVYGNLGLEGGVEEGEVALCSIVLHCIALYVLLLLI
jgi:hypothetical protein